MLKLNYCVLHTIQSPFNPDIWKMGNDKKMENFPYRNKHGMMAWSLRVVLFLLYLSCRSKKFQYRQQSKWHKIKNMKASDRLQDKFQEPIVVFRKRAKPRFHFKNIFRKSELKWYAFLGRLIYPQPLCCSKRPANSPKKPKMDRRGATFKGK